ncbi:hypothetical protein SAMN04488056_112128 [Cohaesibacter marisflavi]|uniref:Carbon monoxide dehydrogenase subunit G n=1 Tax=Cohaesibacter marisflavi TaxID=655353 RepID=A0A1I5JVU1_9HYPH|nr:hypothetical protein [Cohaesibacter marisflavi]SFO76954.1 hypothetical protein SAMN04488056_112128 [Cohaesibacter marisflavi]
MQFKSEYRLPANYKRIKRCLKSPVTLKRLLPNCIDVEQLDSNTLLATINSSVLDGKIIHYLYHFVDAGEYSPYLEVDWQGTDPAALLPKGGHKITLTEEEGEMTVLELNSTLHTTLNGKLVKNDPTVSKAIVSDYFSRFVAEFDQLEGNDMSNDKPEFEDVLHEAKNPVEELEAEAEEAAVKGFLGGPQMWAFIALAIVIILLLVFY